MAQDKCPNSVPSRDKNEVRRRNGKSQQTAQSGLETHLPKPASQRGWVRTITQEKGDTWEAGTPKSYKCRGIQQVTVGPWGPTKEGAWPNISWLFWKREPDPKPTGFPPYCVVCFSFYTVPKLLLMFLCAFFPRDQNGDDSFDFKYFPLSFPAGMGGSMQGDE